MTGRSIVAKTIQGAGWAIGWRLLTRLMGLASTLILVRFLVPDDFGLVALAIGFAGAIETMSNMGTDYALLREEHPDDALLNTAFTIALLRGVLTSAIVIVAAVPIAHFLREPRLTSILYVLAGGYAISAFENVGTIAFRRDFAFAKEFWLLLLPKLAGVVVTVSTALALRSHWALIAGILTMRAGRTLLSYMMHPYRPRLSLAAWRRIAGFSFWLWVNSVVILVRGRIDPLVIGRMTGTMQVAMFEIGSEIARLPVTEFLEPVSRALFPGFAAARHARADMADAYVRTLAGILMFVLPACLGLSAIARPLVALALGPTWASAGDIVEIVAISGVFLTVPQVGGNIFGTLGNTRLLLLLALPGSMLRVPLLLGALHSHGIVGAAATVAAMAALDAALHIRAVIRYLGVRWRHILAQTWRSLLATAMLAILLAATGLGWVSAPPSATASAMHLLLATVTGMGFFVASLAMLWYLAGRPDGAEAALLRLVR